MRVNLRLKILQLRILQVRFHQKLPLHHFLLFFHALFCLTDVSADACDHFHKCVLYNTDFITAVRIRQLDLKISGCHFIRRTRQRPQRLCDCPGHQQQNHQTAYSSRDHNDRTHDFHVFQRIHHHTILVCIASKTNIIEPVDRRLYILVILQCCTVDRIVLFHIPSALGLHGLFCIAQICVRHIPDINLENFSVIVDDITAKLLQHIPQRLCIPVIIFQRIRAFRIQIFINIILRLLQTLGKLIQARIRRIHFIQPAH